MVKSIKLSNLVLTPDFSRIADGGLQLLRTETVGLYTDKHLFNSVTRENLDPKFSCVQKALVITQ